jgi:membrane protein DedA with SNARE-associated domain
MPASDIYGAAQWALAHGYLLLFAAMLIEGPFVTAAGAFAAAFGYFRVTYVLALSILGNLIPDVVFYAIGFWGRTNVVNRFGKYLGVTEERLTAAEKMLAEHAGKALTAIKLIPLLAAPGLIAAGAARIPLKKYIFWSLIITLPSSLIYLIIGYYFGAAYGTIEHYLNIGGYAAIAIIAVLVFTSYLGKKISKKIGERLEK